MYFLPVLALERMEFLLENGQSFSGCCFMMVNVGQPFLDHAGVTPYKVFKLLLRHVHFLVPASSVLLPSNLLFYTNLRLPALPSALHSEHIVDER